MTKEQILEDERRHAAIKDKVKGCTKSIADDFLNAPPCSGRIGSRVAAPFDGRKEDRLLDEQESEMDLEERANFLLLCSELNSPPKLMDQVVVRNGSQDVSHPGFMQNPHRKTHVKQITKLPERTATKQEPKPISGIPEQEQRVRDNLIEEKNLTQVAIPHTVSIQVITISEFTKRRDIFGLLKGPIVITKAYVKESTHPVDSVSSVITWAVCTPENMLIKMTAYDGRLGKRFNLGAHNVTPLPDEHDRAWRKMLKGYSEVTKNSALPAFLCWEKTEETTEQGVM